MKVKKFDDKTIQVTGGKCKSGCNCTNVTYYPFENEEDASMALVMLADTGVEIETQ